MHAIGHGSYNRRGSFARLGWSRFARREVLCAQNLCSAKEALLLFAHGKSALVRLSDSVKLGLGRCVELRSGVFNLLRPEYRKAYADAQAIAKRADQGEIGGDVAEKEIGQLLAVIPTEVALQGLGLQGELHSQALSVILTCCFTLEAYANALAHFLLLETDYLGLLKSGHELAANLLIESFDQMSTARKWETLGRLGADTGFDKSRPPFQDFQCLFRFRDDHVHAKVVAYSDDQARKRYHDKLPDPINGTLDLSHALYAARTYWSMVQEVHRLVGFDQNSFHRHYTLEPWPDETKRQEWESIARGGV
jgi:hypothetical protein